MSQQAFSESRGERFEFGENWTRFLCRLNDRRIEEAQKSLQQMLEDANLTGRSFLDIGSGSGLFSLAARQLGARVWSFDYDSRSVACTSELRRRYFSNDPDWTVEKGSVLDSGYLSTVGQFDIVYSWGVLHHTGAMWQALDNVVPLVRLGGMLFISIYNDQGWVSRAWLWVKRIYNQAPQWLRPVIVCVAFLRLWGPRFIKDLLVGRPFMTWRTYVRSRGMDPWRDVVDWVGGYPFEVAKPEDIFHFFRQRGFALKKLKTCAGGHGCNEFVFVKTTP